MDPTRTAHTAGTLHAELSRNEDDCVRENIIVRVDSISRDRRVALCSVEQCLYGVLRRTYSFQELVRSAEQALAPLSATGLIALITVVPKPADGNMHGAKGPGGWPAAVWQWLGHPLSPKGYGNPVLENDPFGWYKALGAAIPRDPDRSAS